MTLFDKLKSGLTIHVASTTNGTRFSVEPVLWVGNRIGYAFRDEQGRLIPEHRKVFSDADIADASQYWQEVEV
jgi:hypothetical protein